jgi:predicted acyltransferase
MSYCKPLAFIFALRWPLSSLNESSGMMALAEIGVQSLFEAIAGKWEMSRWICNAIRDMASIDA